jgi:proteasome lid subunit RPN8/RPN11
MTVHLKRGQLNYFRRKALATPNEVLAVLFGWFKGDFAVVDRFHYPDLIVATPTATEIDGTAWYEMVEEAEQDGYEVLGNIHSHPNYPPVMSSTDLEWFTDNKSRLCGIVEVTGRKTRTVFWERGTPLSCDIILYK